MTAGPCSSCTVFLRPLGPSATSSRRSVKPATVRSASTSVVTRLVRDRKMSRRTRSNTSLKTCVSVAHALGMEKFDLVGHDWGGMVAWVCRDPPP